MKRWPKFIQENTSEFYDKLWQEEAAKDAGSFDAGRPEQLAKHVDVGDSVCELGCGMWGVCQWLLEKDKRTVSLAAVDISDFVLQWLRARHPHIHRLQVYQRVASETRFDDSLFDVVIAGELIEHFEEPALLVAEMARICKPGGWITISTVDMHCLDAAKNGCIYPEHIWDFTPTDLLELFSPYGRTSYWRFGNYHMVDCHIEKNTRNK